MCINLQVLILPWREELWLLWVCNVIIISSESNNNNNNNSNN